MAESKSKQATEGGADIIRRHRRSKLPLRAALISGLTLSSRILGFVREFLSAALFGDRSPIYDAFITAWRVPNLFRRFLGEGALSTSLQTAMTEADGDGGDQAGRELFLETLRLAAWVLLGVTLLVMAAVSALPNEMPGTHWQWLGPDPGPVREMTLRLMPFLMLICLSALVGGGLQVRGHFAAPSYAPAVLNGAWIATLLFIGFSFGWSTDGLAGGAGALRERHLEMARVLGWGVILAGVLQLAVQIPALKRNHLLPGRSPPRGGRRPAREGWTGTSVLKRSAPLALGAAVYQINVLIDGLMAEGLLPDGGPTTLYLANRVQQFPLALVAVAATSAVFPALKALGHRGERGELRRLHDETHLAVLFLALPAAAGLIALAEPVVGLLFHHGAFGAEGVERTAGALTMLCIALPAAGAVGLTSRTYYALGDFRTPVVISTVMLVVNVGLNLLCVLVLGLDVEGLALATAVTSWGNLLVLLPGLVRRLPAPEGRPGAGQMAGRLLRMVLASAFCAGLARVVYEGIAPEVGDGVGLALAIVLAAPTYALASMLLRVPEWRSFVSGVRSRGGR